MTLRRRPTNDELIQAIEARDNELRGWGAKLLTEVYDFLGRFVAYPSEAAHVAHTLWVGHTFFMDCWDSTPRIAFLSPEPGSGKSRALEVTEPLVNRPVHAVNVSPSYLFRKVSDDEGLPVILYDEIDTIFGPRAKDNEDIRGLLNAGHRRGAIAGRCVTRGKTIITEDFPAYAAVALAGLDDLPDTLQSRSVIVRMRRRAPNERVEPWRNRLNTPEGEALRERLQAWAKVAASQVQWPEMPDGVEDRDADIWEALLAVANMAGGEWPERARVTAVTLVTDSKRGVPSLGIRLLGDIRQAFGALETMRTDDMVKALNKLDDAPWAEIKNGHPLDSRDLARRLRKYDIHNKPVRVGGVVVRGYTAESFWDAWTRYLVTDVADPTNEASPINTEKVIKEEEGNGEVVGALGPSPNGSVTSVTPVTNGSGVTAPTCRECGRDLIQPHSIERSMCESCFVAAA